MKTEATPNQITYQDDNFRTYTPERVKNYEGRIITIQLCEELDPESGRWEPFYSTRSL